MKRIQIIIAICLAALFFTEAVLAEISATIDRSEIALDETLNLTISRTGGVSFSSADLTPLEKNFRIVGRSQSSNTRIVNGAVSSSTTLDLVLAPKSSGILEIPSLTVGGEKSESLQVKVLTRAQPKTRADNAPLFIETELDKEVVPVQGQLLFTLRIYWAVEASIAQPADPRLQDAILERLDDATFNKTIDGRSYRVFERKYAIFPQKSGELEIPQLTVQATVADRQPRGSLYDFFGTRGREVKLRSESKKVAVLEKPPQYPAGAVWLPTDKLSIAEEWSGEPDGLRVGESITVTIATAGRGLLAAQLPPIELPETEGVKLYQGKAEVENLTTPDGLTGIRKESIALIPVKPGQAELPEIRIPWWNLKEGRVEYAVVPARQLKIEPAAGPGTNSAPPAAPSMTSQIAAETRPAKDSSAANPGLDLPFLLALFFALVWLVTLFLLLKARRLAAGLPTDKEPDSGADLDFKEKDAFRKLRLACRSNDPHRAREALLKWAGSRGSGQRVRTGSDLEKLFPGSGLAGLLAELDRSLYGREGRPAEWRGMDLLAELENLRKNGDKVRPRKTALPSLYK